MNDRDKKGRQVSPRGEVGHNAKISDAQVDLIRELSERGMSAPYIAQIVPISLTQIKRIRSNKSRVKKTIA